MEGGRLGSAAASGDRGDRSGAESLVQGREVSVVSCGEVAVVHVVDEMAMSLSPNSPDDNWQALTNALAGLFCSSLGQIDKSITSSPQDIFPEEGTEGQYISSHVSVIQAN